MRGPCDHKYQSEYAALREQLGEREVRLWAPLWDSLLVLCETTGNVDDSEDLAVCRTAGGAVTVTAGLVRAMRQAGNSDNKRLQEQE